MTGAPRDYLTIVSGLPRSGTSMMMRMIDAGGIPALIDHVRKADEDNPEGYYEFEAVKKTKKDASWLDDAAGKVVKMVHLLLLDLPLTMEYRVVFMRRRLEEVIRSQNVMLERKGKDTGKLTDEQVINVFKSQMDKVDAYARQHGQHFKMLYVDYNEVVKNPAPAVHAVNTFLGGDLNSAAMLEVVDPKLYRQRK